MQRYFYLVGYVLLIILVFFSVVLLYVFTFGVRCCDVRYDFRIKPMLGSSLPSVVCKTVHALFTLFLFVCLYWFPTHIVLRFCSVLLRFVYLMLPVSLYCPFLIAPSVFSIVYLQHKHTNHNFKMKIHITQVIQIRKKIKEMILKLQVKTVYLDIVPVIIKHQTAKDY